MGWQAIFTRRWRQPGAVYVFFLQTVTYGDQNALSEVTDRGALALDCWPDQVNDIGDNGAPCRQLLALGRP